MPLWSKPNNESTSVYFVTNLNLAKSLFAKNSIALFKEWVYGSTGIGSDVAEPSNMVILGFLSSIYFWAWFNISSTLTFIFT